MSRSTTASRWLVGRNPSRTVGYHRISLRTKTADIGRFAFGVSSHDGLHARIGLAQRGRPVSAAHARLASRQRREDDKRKLRPTLEELTSLCAQTSLSPPQQPRLRQELARGAAVLAALTSPSCLPSWPRRHRPCPPKPLPSAAAVAARRVSSAASPPPPCHRWHCRSATASSATST